MSVIVTCPECGAKLKLKSRAILGKTRPCPKCKTPFLLYEENNEPDYDLDARGVELRQGTRSEPEEPKTLTRGSTSRPNRDNLSSKDGSDGLLDFSNRPLAIGIGAGVLISVGMLLGWLVMGGGSEPAPNESGQETAAVGTSQPGSDSGTPATSPRTGAPLRTREVNPARGREPT